MITDRLLRLRAEDADDLEVVSACMQDAIARIGDMTYMSRLRRFALVATRFRWELAREVGPEGGQRIRSGLHFDDVLRVRSQGIDMADREGLLPLLAIRAEPAGDLVIALAGDLEGDVVAGLRVGRLEPLVVLVLGVLEKRERAAVAEPEESMAKIDLALEHRIESPLAPRRHQRNPQHVL